MTAEPKTDAASFAAQVTPAVRALSFLAFAIGSFAIGSAEFSGMVLLPEIQDFMNINADQAGHFVSFYASGVFVGAPLLAVLTARIPRKGLLIGFMLFYALFNFLSVLCAGNYYAYALMRFLSGLPHGIYFGVACIFAASMVRPEKRPAAIGYVMLGLTIATIAGVAIVTWIGQNIHLHWLHGGKDMGWTLAFIMVSSIALLAAIMIAIFVPRVPHDKSISPLSELNGLKNKQLWLLLLVIGVGSASTFSVYTYIREILADVSHAPENWMPFVLPLFGLGMVFGNLFGPRVALWMGLMPSIFWTLLWTFASFVIFYLLVGAPIGAAIAVFIIGANFMSQPSIQTRIMDVSPHARTLATALMQSVYNIANALGAYAGGLGLIAAGKNIHFGLMSTIWIGAAFALGGLLIFCYAWHDDRKSSKAV